MTAEPFQIIQHRQAVVYDGTNSADIEALVTHLDTIAVTSGVWTFYSPSDPAMWTANPGDLVLFNQGYVFDVINPATFDFLWKCAAICDDIPDVSELTGVIEGMQEDLTGLEDAVGAAVLSVGAASVGTVLALATVVVAVPLITAMPSGSYTATAGLFGGLNLGPLNITAVTVVDADTVNVTVQNTGLLSLGGAHIIVTAKL